MPLAKKRYYIYLLLYVYFGKITAIKKHTQNLDRFSECAIFCSDPRILLIIHTPMIPVVAIGF